jgi:hypothetical protein
MVWRSAATERDLSGEHRHLPVVVPRVDELDVGTSVE